MTKMHLTVAAALIGALIPLFAGQASARNTTIIHVPSPVSTNIAKPTNPPLAPASRATIVHESTHVKEKAPFTWNNYCKGNISCQPAYWNAHHLPTQ
jgi:hypothetical protein